MLLVDDVDEQFGEFQAAMDKETREFELTGQTGRQCYLVPDLVIPLTCYS